MSAQGRTQQKIKQYYISNKSKGGNKKVYPPPTGAINQLKPMKIYENPSTSIKFNFECILKLLKPLLGPSSLDHPSGILWGILLVYFGVYFCPMDDAGRNHTTTGAKKASPRLGGILFFFPLAFIRNHALGVPLCGHGPSLYTLIDNRF